MSVPILTDTMIDRGVQVVRQSERHNLDRRNMHRVSIGNSAAQPGIVHGTGSRVANELLRRVVVRISDRRKPVTNQLQERDHATFRLPHR